MASKQTVRDQATQTMARHFFGRADVGLHAFLPRPCFSRYVATEERIVVGTPRTLSTKRKHPKKKNMRVSLAATESIPSNRIVEVLDQGTESMDPRGFKAIVESLRKKKPIKRASYKKATKPVVRSSSKLKIRAVIPSMVEAILRRKQEVKNKWRELFNDDEDPEAIELTISPREKALIETLDVNNNDVST